MIFAVAATAGYGHLEDQIKEYIALQEIKKEINAGDWETLKGKLPEIKEDINTIEDNLSYNVRKIYNTLYVGGNKIDLGMPTAAKENLSSWFKRELEFKEKIVRNLHYRMIIQRFMSDRDELETKTILEQFYKNTELPMLEDENVLRRTIQKAVADGALGLAIIEEGEIDEVSFRYKQTIPPDDITFDENEYVLSKEKVEKLICPQCRRLLINGACPNVCPKCGTHLIQGRCPKCEVGPGPVERCEICGSLLVNGKCSNICVECGTHLVDGICPNTCRECGTHLVNGVCPKCGVEQEKYREVLLRIEDIPATKIADLNRGVLLPISREIGGFKLTLEIDITNDDGISKETIEKIVKETISQIGARITKEKLK